MFDIEGEIALMDVTGKRAANVLALSHVHTMTLSRAEFSNLLQTLRTALIDFPDRKTKNTARGINFIKRRMTTIDSNNLRNMSLIPGFIHKMCRFMMGKRRIVCININKHVQLHYIFTYWYIHISDIRWRLVFFIFSLFSNDDNQTRTHINLWGHYWKAYGFESD